MGEFLLFYSRLLLCLVPRSLLYALLCDYSPLLLRDSGRLHRWDFRRCLCMTLPCLLLGDFSIL